MGVESAELALVLAQNPQLITLCGPDGNEKFGLVYADFKKIRGLYYHVPSNEHSLIAVATGAGVDEILSIINDLLHQRARRYAESDSYKLFEMQLISNSLSLASYRNKERKKSRSWTISESPSPAPQHIHLVE
jgi:hypothetical protein